MSKTVKDAVETFANNRGPNWMQEAIDNQAWILHCIDFGVLTRHNQTPKPEVSPGFIENCRELQKHRHVFLFIASHDLQVLREALSPLGGYYSITSGGQVLAYNGHVFESTLRRVDTVTMIAALTTRLSKFETVEIYAQGEGVVVWRGMHHTGIADAVAEQLDAECYLLNERDGDKTWIVDSFSGWDWLHMNRPTAPDRNLQLPPIAYQHAALHPNKVNVDNMPIETYLRYREFLAFCKIAESRELDGYKLAYAGPAYNAWSIMEYVVKNKGDGVVVKETVGPVVHASNRDVANATVVGVPGLNGYLAQIITQRRLKQGQNA